MFWVAVVLFVGLLIAWAIVDICKDDGQRPGPRWGYD